MTVCTDARDLPHLAVIGTIFVDCKGFSKTKYDACGRNLGDVQFVHGGVGRNVAENLSNLQVNTTFIATADNSAIGMEVVKRLSSFNVKCEYIVRADTQGMGFWLALLSGNGDLLGSISQMPDLKLLEELLLRKGDEIVRNCSHLALELDLNKNITHQAIALARKYRRPAFGIPANLEVILDNIDILAELECFICNDIEAEKIMQKELKGLGIEQLLDGLVKFVEQKGLSAMVITLGSNGAVYYDAKSIIKGYQPVIPTTVVDTSGAGDAFFSGTVTGLVHGKSLAEAVFMGTQVASWTIQSRENTCLTLAEKVKNGELGSKES